MTPRTPRTSLALFALILALSAAVYLPGVSGPYVFDDHPNIVDNTYVQINSLGFDELRNAMLSTGSGPLLRPVSMLSFALSYYFASGFDQTTPFKLANLAIHIVNGLLVFWLMRLILGRLAETQTGNHQNPSLRDRWNKNDLLAAAVALLWIVHPINLTSVLYIVQRMTSLSTLFTLLGLICYLIGRNRTVAGHAGGMWLIGTGLFACGGLGVLSKENAALLPFFMLTLEFTLFANEAPWPSWSQLSTRTKGLILTVSLAVVTAAIFWIIDFSLPGYARRDFSMVERLLTESRVLFFYLSLILLPRINQFGLYHDDIALSTSLFTPWTTLPSLAGLIILLGLVWAARRRLPLLSMGILWFFVGHLMESTLLPLEITHEHRNYLAGLGILFAVVYVLDQAHLRLGYRKIWLLYPVIVIILAGTTVMRATHWSSYNSLAHYTAHHHPDSMHAQAMLGASLYAQQNYRGARVALRRAATLAPDEPGYRMNIQLLDARLGDTPKPNEQDEILRLLATGRSSIVTQRSLDYIAGCISTKCPELQTHMEAWLNTLIENLPPTADLSYYYYLLGRTLVAQGKVRDGLNTLERAYQADPNYLHPLFEIANVFLGLGQTENAELMLQRLRTANANNLHPREKEIAELETAIERLKNEARERSRNRS